MPQAENVVLHGEHGEFTYAQLASNVARELTRAFNKEKQYGLTRVEIANRLKLDKSFVTRCMNGGGNLTLRTVAALFAAMGYQVEVSARRIDALPDDRSRNSKNAVTHNLALEIIPSTSRLATPSGIARTRPQSFEFGT